MATQVAPFIQQSSYGRAALLYTVTPRLYRLPQTASFYATRSMGYELIADAQVAVDCDFATANYDSIAVLFSSLGNLPGSQITYGGASELGGRNIWINGEFDFRVMAHELGHNFGLWHANLWQVSDRNPISADGVSVQYQDCFDVMGSNLANDNRVDYNPWFKNQLGWVRDDQIQVIKSSGTYRVRRFDSPAATGTLALKIVKDITRSYWVSYRGNFTDNASLQNGAYIIWGYNVIQGSDLLDMTTPGAGIKDAALQVGATFSDPMTHLRIAPSAKGGVPPEEYLDISIDFGPASPVISLGPQDQLVTPGQTAVFSLQAAGNPKPSIQWQRKPADGTDWTDLLDGQQYHGSHEPTLTILDTTLAMNADQFRCVVSNSSGTLTSAPPVFLSVIQSGFTTFAGMGQVQDSINGVGGNSRFGGPCGLTVDGAGNVFVADSVNSNLQNNLRKLSEHRGRFCRYHRQRRWRSQ